MECCYCHKKLGTKRSLKVHQRSTKYCLKIQGNADKKGGFLCECGKDYILKHNFNLHVKKCNTYKMKCVEENVKLQTENEMLKKNIKEIQNSYEKLALTAIKRPTNTKNIQVNNFLINAKPVKLDDIKNSIQYLSLEHHKKGAEGYADFMLEYPLKDKVICTDIHRGMLRYNGDDGKVVNDVGCKKIMLDLCQNAIERSFDLCRQHYEALRDEYTEKEIENCNYMEPAVSIAKGANGGTNNFCNQMAKSVSRKSAKF